MHCILIFFDILSLLESVIVIGFFQFFSFIFNEKKLKTLGINYLF